MDVFLGFKFLAVCLLDVVMGDPRWFPHPVRLLGAVIQWCDQLIDYLCQSPLGKRTAGIVLALGLPYGSYVMVREVIGFMDSLNEALGMITWIVLGYTTLAARDLWDHARQVYEALTEQELSESRIAVSQLVGRDTAHLSESDIVRATIESVSENTSDGIVAPLLYLALGGPSLAMAYKAVNTLDSMIGYRNARYRDLGWASARLDDVLNWIPARLTALGISVAAALRLGTGKAACRMCWRDARKHLSPNSGWPEAAMAGALDVQLGGANKYGGLVEERATLGDLGRPLAFPLILSALQLMGLASILLMVVFFVGVVVC